MTVFGTLSVDGFSVQFRRVETPQGFVNAVQQVQEEELTTAGVNGRRWRTIFLQFPEFDMETTADAADVGQGINLKRAYELMKGGLGTLTVVVGGRSWSFKDVHVLQALPVVVPGQLVGVGFSMAASYVDCQWRIALTDEGA